MSQKSDFPIAATGFFLGAIVLALVLFFISNQTTKSFNARTAAEHAK